MSASRERAVFWAGIALLVVGTLVAYRLLLGPEPGSAPPPPPAVAAAPPDPALRLAVEVVTGEVTVVRAGVRTRAAAGDELRPDDAIETAPGARVELAGGSYDVALEEGGRFDVKEITGELSRFRLGAGAVSARVEADPSRSFEIEAAPDAVMRTRGGELSVSRAGAVMAVGVRRGSAEFSAAGRSVVLGKLQQSLAAAGKPPSKPVPLPKSLLLKVRWPEARETNRRRIVVTGHTLPGASVLLGGEPVEVQPDGRFTHVVVLKEGRQRLTATAHGVAGSAGSRGPVIVLDTRAPDARFQTRDLWVRPRH
jgi:hypothetical protein